MKNQCMRILAIDPGTRNIGVAVIEGTNLLYFGVKIIPKSIPRYRIISTGLAILRGITTDFGPSILAVERTYFPRDRNGSVLNRFAQEMTMMGRRLGLEVVTLSPMTVRKRICGSGRAGKRDVAIVLSSRYPELRPYRSSDRRWKTRFYYNFFDAIAVGLAIIMVDTEHSKGLRQ